MLRPLLAAAAIAFAGPAFAQTDDPLAPLVDALGLPALLEVMRDEGLGYGEELGSDLLQGRGGQDWPASVGAIYDVGRMRQMLRDNLEADLDAAQIPDILAFFQTETGRHIVDLEVAARRALLDEDVKTAAHEDWLALETEGGERWQLLSRFAEVNDLVESNVAGAMNANYAFYRGLSEGGAFDGDLPEDQILTDVWNREQEIRQDTVDWVFSFTSLAYRPLSDEDFGAYVDFAETDAGQALNSALFNAFNDMFTTISRDLGLSAAHFLAGQDI